MLRKVLKYDLKSLWLPWTIMSVTVLGLSIFSGFALRILMSYDFMAIANVMQILPIAFSAIMLCIAVIAISIYAIAPTFIVLFRFYKNLFTDEGYLTFTLPVRRSTILNSKLLTNLIFSVATTLVVTISLVIALLISPGAGGKGVALTELFKGINYIIVSAFGNIDGWVWTHIIALVFSIIAWSAFSSLFAFACVTVGCVLVKKLKLLVSIIIYYFASSGISLISYLFNWIYSMITAVIALGNYSYTVTMSVSLFSVIAYGMIGVVLCVLIYCFILRLIERRLNLA